MITSRTRTRTRAPKLATGLVLILITGGLAACGGGSERSAEQMLNDAQQALRDARNDVLEASERLKEKEEALAVAKVEVEKAREQVHTAQAQLDSVEKTVDLKATDGLLFRAIQRKLLDDERLEEAVVSVHVDKGLVTLRGQVPSDEEKEIAVEIARQVPGVASVTSELKLAPAGS